MCNHIEVHNFKSILGASSCDTCPEGSKCENATSSPTVCNAGYMAAAGSAACTICANSKYLPV